MRKYLVFAVLAVALACSPNHEQAKAEPPVNQHVTDTLTRTIWPAVNAYQRDVGQGGPGYQALAKVLSPTVLGRPRTDLYQAVRDLGTVPAPEMPHGKLTPSTELRIASTEVASATEDATSLTVCYTYTATTWDDQSPRNSASEVTVELTNTVGTWYLHSITNDHVVPSCESNKA